VKQVVSQSLGASNGTFVTDRVGNIEISFVECSARKKVHLQPDIVEYSPGDQAPMYDLACLWRPALCSKKYYDSAL
jgi:hypothetical protein